MVVLVVAGAGVPVVAGQLVVVAAVEEFTARLASWQRAARAVGGRLL
jgi:hypothetical protein